ncbi:unnamed protein product [Chondrus crispus]|uniref:Peptidase M20 dimerisation domain-containing protein n=1 Tax=Chondrus crispus TaxID=2769 RepID=R7QNT8_CHOCR|nr:unnamed protein product [Chondrus crispus]CDF39769.1 unnamed protein product [Chondrus crispus]|eukprot:XP_005710063.1 unnamed protein product [Chondrus crispus]
MVSDILRTSSNLALFESTQEPHQKPVAVKGAGFLSRGSFFHPAHHPATTHPLAPKINLERVLSELKTLATHSDLTPPAVQRVVYTSSDLSARTYLQRIISEANLAIHEDVVGNLFAVWRGSSSSQSRAVATGSHIDAIPHSGMYDGVLGVLGGLEAIRSLKEAGFTPSRDVHLIMFTSEEPTRFGIGCLGSRVLSAELPHEYMYKLVDSNGTTLDEARKAAGFTKELSEAILPDDTYSAFVELHIEQADSLERSSTHIGAVTSIAAPAQAAVRFSGSGGHAGALPMAERHDPGLAGAELALEVEKAALDGQSNYSVATTGRFEVFPGAVNSVPRTATLELDVRNVELEERNEMLTRIRDSATKIAERRGVRLEFNVTNADAPADCNKHIVEMVAQAAQESGLSYSRLVSRAYHDSLFMARKFPTGMIFVPCRGGVSHRPDDLERIVIRITFIRSLANFRLPFCHILIKASTHVDARGDRLLKL